MASSRLKRLRRRLRSALLRAAFRLLSFLPCRFALQLGAFAGTLAFWVASRQRRLALEHLAVAYPEKSEVERRAIARASFVHFGRAAMELAVVRKLDSDREGYVTLDPAAERLLREAKSQGRGIVFATGHMGNWELLARRLARSGMEPLVVARRSWDERLDSFVARLRAEGGVATVWREDPGAARQLLAALRAGRGLGILMDQDTKVQGVFVPFFGRPAFTPRAAADLALRFQAPLFVGWSKRRGSDLADGYVLELEPVPYDSSTVDRDAEVHRVIATCTARLESAIRARPEEWAWVHQRWKTVPESHEASGVPKTRALSSG